MPVLRAQTTQAWDWVRFRRRHHLTQIDLAQQLGVSLRTVWNVERGRRQGRPPWVPKAPGRKAGPRFYQLQKQWERPQLELPWED